VVSVSSAPSALVPLKIEMNFEHVTDGCVRDLRMIYSSLQFTSCRTFTWLTKKDQLSAVNTYLYSFWSSKYYITCSECKRMCQSGSGISFKHVSSCCMCLILILDWWLGPMVYESVEVSKSRVKFYIKIWIVSVNCLYLLYNGSLLTFTYHLCMICTSTKFKFGCRIKRAGGRLCLATCNTDSSKYVDSKTCLYPPMKTIT